MVRKTSSKTAIIVGLSMFFSRAKSENDEINSTLFIAISSLFIEMTLVLLFYLPLLTETKWPLLQRFFYA